MIFSVVWFPLLMEVFPEKYATNANQGPVALGRADRSCLLSLPASASSVCFHVGFGIHSFGKNGLDMARPKASGRICFLG